MNSEDKVRQLLICPLCRTPLVIVRDYYCCPQALHSKMVHWSYLYGQLEQLLGKAQVDPFLRRWNQEHHLNGAELNGR